MNRDAKGRTAASGRRAEVAVASRRNHVFKHFSEVIFIRNIFDNDLPKKMFRNRGRMQQAQKVHRVLPDFFKHVCVDWKLCDCDPVQKQVARALRVAQRG